MSFGIPFKPSIKFTITQTFNEHEKLRKERGWIYYNGGIDYYFFELPVGTPILATDDGIVLEATTDPQKKPNGAPLGGYGQYVKIRHQNGYTSLYGHLSGWEVEKGENVHKGQVIGYSGNTGNSTGPHLHFELRNASNIAVDPELYYELPFADPVITPQPADTFTVIEAGVRARREMKIDSKNVIFTPSVGMKFNKYGDPIDNDGYTWQPAIFYIATKDKAGKPFIR